jgi:hypothetical protein
MNTRISYLERSIFVIVMALLFTPLIFAPSAEATQKNDEKSLARQIIEKAREAIFGSSQVGDIKGLSLTRKTKLYYRLAGIQETGESNIDLLLPDKMVIREVIDSPGNRGQTTYYRVLNGNQSWKDTRSSSSEHLVIRDPADDDPVRRLQSVRRDQAFQLIQMMLPPSPDFPLTFSYAGEARASDGQANVIDVKGPDDFSARLFIDKATSRLLMMTFTRQGVTSFKISSRDSKGSAPTLPTGRIEIKLRYLEYKQVDGVTLPHLVTQETDGHITRESELSRFQLNPTFAPGHFDPGKERK